MPKVTDLVYHMEDFLVLMGNYDNVLKYTEASLDSAGSAQKKFNDCYQEGIDSKINSMKASFEGFSEAFVNSDFVKHVVETVSALLEFGSSDMGKAIAQIALLTAGISLFGIAVKALAGSTFLSQLMYFPTAFAEIAAAQGVLTATTQSLTFALTANPLFMAVSAGILLFGVATAIDHFSISLKDLNEEIETTTAKISEMQSEFNTLSAKENITSAEKERLELLRAQIKAKQDIVDIDKKQAFDKEFNKPEKEYKSREGIEDYNKTGTDKLRDLISEYDKLSERKSKDIDEDNKIKKKKAELTSSIADYVVKLQDAKDAGSQLTKEQESLLVSASGLLYSYDQLAQETLSATTNAINTLDNAILKINSSQALSQGEVDKLIALYPQLKDSIYQTADGWMVEKGAIDTIVPALSNLSSGYASYQQLMNNAVSSGVAARLGILATELAGIQTLADAYSLLAQKTGSVGRTKEELYAKFENEVDPAKKKDYQQILALGSASEKIKNLKINTKPVGGGGYTPAPSGGGKKDKGGSKSDKKDAWKEEFEAAYKALKHQREMDEISLRDYYDTLTGLDNKYFAGKQKYIEDHRKNLEELHDVQKQLLDDYVANIEHEILVTSKKEGTEDRQIALYRHLIDKLKKQEDEYIKQGLDKNDKLLQELQRQQIDYADKIKDIQDGILEHQKKAIEDSLQATIDIYQERLDNYNSVISAVTEVIDGEIEKLNKEKESLQKSNDERERAVKLAELEDNLLKARNNKSLRIYHADTNEWSWEADPKAIKSAQKELDDFHFDEKIRGIDEQIASLEDYKEQWTSVSDHYKKEQDRLMADQILGKNWEKDILNERLSTFRSFADEYNNIASSLQAAQTKMSVFTGSPDNGNAKNSSLEQMKKNSEDWHKASPELKKALEAANNEIGSSLGLSKGNDGVWRDSSGNAAYTTSKNSLITESGDHVVLLDSSNSLNLPNLKDIFSTNFVNPLKDIVSKTIGNIPNITKSESSTSIKYDFSNMKIEHSGNDFGKLVSSMQQYAQTHR